MVTVVIPTYEDYRMTRASVATVMAADVPAGMSIECIVIDNGSGPLTAQVLDALALQHDRLTVLHEPSNFGYALGNNLALRHATGGTIVFLNNDTKVERGWLGPLVEKLADPDVLAAQSLLLYPTGTIQCAGIAFPACGGLPYPFLSGFPVEDADRVDEVAFAALTGAALAMRWDDVVALRGFDPLFRNGMEDVDICLRLARLRPGRFVVSPDSRVTHLESRTPGRYAKVVRNRRLYLERWRDAAPARRRAAVGPARLRGRRPRRPQRHQRGPAVVRAGTGAGPAPGCGHSRARPGCGGPSRTPPPPASGGTPGGTRTSPGTSRARCVRSARRWSSTAATSTTARPDTSTT